MSTSEIKKTKKKLQGVVVSEKMDKTRTVSVERLFRHPVYEKILKRSSKFYAHDESGQSKKGDIVEIVSTRPISKLKRWRVSKVIEKAVR